MEYGCAVMPRPSAGMIFIGLLILAFLIIIIYRLLNRNKNRNEGPANERLAEPAREGEGMQPPRADLRESETSAGPVAAAARDRGLFDAIIASALAEYMGSDIAGLRIRSIRRLGAKGADRGAFTAVLSAAIASAMGEDVRGIRILSIRKIEKTTQTGGQYA
ncbi:MAG: hypothetical protein BWY35_01790 [Firmicutes bacterium ADurb.Bin248]|nr:MAG: hypothetical protein BWY35_01790 [Firmicutes bacterium ADurb.Bin248]